MMSTAPRSRFGPVCPNPDVDAYTSAGFSSDSASYPNPRRSIVPGVKFSVTTSARRTSRCTISVASGALRSSMMLFLPRFTEKK